MNRKRYILIFSIILLLAPVARSQSPFTVKDLGSDYLRAMELYNKEKYPAAIKLFDSYIENEPNKNLISVSEAEYYRAASSLNLFNPDGEYRMVTFIRRYPESPRINDAYMDLGNYFYQNRNYRKAVSYYQKVNRQELDPEALAEYFFRNGYSLYMRGDKPKALLMFSEIKDIDTEYTPPAIYYFSQIAYEDKNYLTAMDGFNRLKDDETFGSIVPFYIVQILYLQKDYDGILQIAPELLNSAGKERSVELYRFIGDAYFNKENYKEALPYLEKFSSGTKMSGREDKYQLGFCYYKTGNVDKAIATLLSIGSKSDELSQNIWYVLGDCYLKKGDKKRAQLGFSEASRLDFDKKIREDALFNYAKLTYELSYSPFGEAILAFNQYIELYPASDRVEEVYNYLVSTYLQAKNYRAALMSLDKVRNKSSKLEEAYQRVAFFRGLELFNNMELEAASDMLDRSLVYGKYNNQLRARALYWKGEASYRMGRYEDARKNYTEFLGIPGSSKLNENSMVRYNLGYAYFNLKDYPNALTHLKAFESEVANVKTDVMADARNRIADCYYITTNYPQAITYYDKVIDYGRVEADYAMYQKGFCLGLMNNQQGKADVLTLLTQRYPASTYVPAAIFERGRAYLVMEDFRRGEADFNTIINSYRETQMVPRAMVQLGLLYNNLGDNRKAIEQYKKVIENYRSTPEARYALTGLKNVYIEMNDVESYFSYVKNQQGSSDINLSEKDSLLYASGENLYFTAKYDRAADIFNNYLKEFPAGIFASNAQFYLAECYRTTGKKDEALKLYIALAEKPNNEFTEQSLALASDIYYEREDYSFSFDYYGRLEKVAGSTEKKIAALRGQLRSAYQMGDAQKTLTIVEKINSSPHVPEELTREALFMKAKANYSLNNFAEALTDFRKLSREVVSSEGAESKYRVAELLFRENQTEESEKTVLEFIDQKSPHEYWMARMFILLSDISVRKGDMLQAKVTLESLRDYYTIKDDGILDEVKSKLESMTQNN
jgi:TolA-binding protein